MRKMTETERRARMAVHRRALETMRSLGVTRTTREDMIKRARHADVKLWEMRALYAEYGIHPLGWREPVLEADRTHAFSAMEETWSTTMHRRLMQVREQACAQSGRDVPMDNIYEFLAWLSGGAEDARELAVRDTFRLKLLTIRLEQALPPQEERTVLEQLASRTLQACAEILEWPYREQYDHSEKIRTCAAYAAMRRLDTFALETTRIAERLIGQIQAHFGVSWREAITLYNNLAIERGARPYDETVRLYAGKEEDSV